MIGEIAVAGHSWLHRLSAGRKMLVLLLAGTALFFVRAPWLMALMLAAVALAWVSSGVGWRPLWHQGRWLLVLLLAVTAVTTAFEGSQAGGLSGLRLATLMGLALLVSLTTRSADMVEALEQALAPLGRRGWVQPERIAFGLALTLRFAPELARRWTQLKEAQRARGIRAHPVRLAVPLLIHLLQSADQIAEAIDARGWPPDAVVDEPDSVDPPPADEATGGEDPMPPRRIR